MRPFGILDLDRTERRAGVAAGLLELPAPWTCSVGHAAGAAVVGREALGVVLIEHLVEALRDGRTDLLAVCPVDELHDLIGASPLRIRVLNRPCQRRQVTDERGDRGVDDLISHPPDEVEHVGVGQHRQQRLLDRDQHRALEHAPLPPEETTA